MAQRQTERHWPPGQPSFQRPGRRAAPHQPAGGAVWEESQREVSSVYTLFSLW